MASLLNSPAPCAQKPCAAIDRLAARRTCAKWNSVAGTATCRDLCLGAMGWTSVRWSSAACRGHGGGSGHRAPRSHARFGATCRGWQIEACWSRDIRCPRVSLFETLCVTAVWLCKFATPAGSHAAGGGCVEVWPCACRLKNGDRGFRAATRPRKICSPTTWSCTSPASMRRTR